MDHDTAMPGTAFFDFSAHVAACLTGPDGVTTFGLADGSIARVAGMNAQAADRFSLHEGAVLCLAASPDGGVFSGGDDGRLIQFSPLGDAVTLLEVKGTWVEHLAVSESMAVAAAAGTTVHLFSGPDQPGRALSSLPSAARGLAFSPDGLTLAASHYGGVSLWNAAEPDLAPRVLPLPGLCLELTFDPTGRLLAVANQEKRLYLIDLESGQGRELSGLSRKPVSLSFKAGANALLFAGEAGFALWNLEQDAADAKALFCVQEETYLSRAAAHPAFPMAAGGFSEGSVFLADLASQNAAFVFNLEAQKVTALSWSGDGMLLAGGGQGGMAFTALLPVLLGM